MKAQAFPFLVDSPDASIWVSAFEDVSLRKFADQFFKLEADPAVEIIPVFISSYGGSVHNYLAMRDIIRSSNKKVATIAIGKAMSAGAALLAAGTKGLRFVTPNTTIMVHEISSGAWGKSTEIQVSATETERLNNVFLQSMSEDMGMTLEALKSKLHNLKNSDWFLSAPEAIKYGLVDAIEVPRMAEGQQARGLISFTKDEPAPKTKKKSVTKKRKK